MRRLGYKYNQYFYAIFPDTDYAVLIESMPDDIIILCTGARVSDKGIRTDLSQCFPTGRNQVVSITRTLSEM